MLKKRTKNRRISVHNGVFAETSTWLESARLAAHVVFGFVGRFPPLLRCYFRTFKFWSCDPTPVPTCQTRTPAEHFPSIRPFPGSRMGAKGGARDAQGSRRPDSKRRSPFPSRRGAPHRRGHADSSPLKNGPAEALKEPLREWLFFSLSPRKVRDIGARKTS